MDTEKDKTDSETPKKKVKRIRYFNKNWLNDSKIAKFKNWLLSVSYDNTCAMCKVCNCKFTIKCEGLVLSRVTLIVINIKNQ
jgi:hypothetical protein